MQSRPLDEPGFVGMQVQGMSDEIAAVLGLPQAHGVLVRDVALGGPSDRAGFRRGDLIVEFDGRPIDSFETMLKVVGETKARHHRRRHAAHR
jgi:serine protease Do